jgi:hypothetical protein
MLTEQDKQAAKSAFSEFNLEYQICENEDLCIKMFESGIKHAREAQWIPVSERLPEESGRYLCYVKEINDLGISYFQWNCAFNKNDTSWSDKLVRMEVTHWQPLPEPPKSK